MIQELSRTHTSSNGDKATFFQLSAVPAWNTWFWNQGDITVFNTL